MLYDLINMKYPENIDLQRQKADQWLPKGEGIFLGYRNILNLDFMVFAKPYNLTKNHLKHKNFMACNYISIKLLKIREFIFPT